MSEHVYAELVPGLTNATDRISNYSFYPWLIWAYGQENRTRSTEDLVEVIRKAECAATLIAALHSLKDGDDDGHVGGLTGRQTLGSVARRLESGEKVRLSELATQGESETRYFKHRYGGLGQNYLGALRQVGVLRGDAKSGIKYTTERGEVLASLLDERVDRKGFFKVLRSDRVDAKALADLGGFCPCRLATNDAEREGLSDFLLNRRGRPFHDPLGEARRETIALLLDVAASAPEIEGDGSIIPLAARFLDASYAGALPDAGTWGVSPALVTTRKRWAAYQRHELLSVAIQALFWAGLAELQEEGGRLPTAEAYGKWFARVFKRNVDGDPVASVEALVRREAKELPPIEMGDEVNHELRVADRLIQAFRDGERHAAVREAVVLLAALLARDDGMPPYADLEFPRGYFDTYEINLLSLRRRSRETWKALTAEGWLSWLAARWGVLAHIRIALRKLHHESLETFRIIPREDGLEVVEPPEVKRTNPRLVQLIRSLVDLGLLDRSRRLTDEGHRVREELRGK